MTKDIFKNDGRRRVAVIGAGAAGMMAAIFAARNGADVAIIEKNNLTGKKLRITGKGRCNLTNNCDINEFLNNVTGNGRFLYAALNRFSPADTMEFFESLGVPLKVERGKRVFPVSDKASDIVKALNKSILDEEIGLIHGKVTGLDISSQHVQGIYIDGVKKECDAIIVCTGGLSYPMTGSDGDGYKFAVSAGHTITDIKPSLVPIVSPSPVCRRMQGLSLKNVTFRIKQTENGKTIFEDFGEMMFTHFGVTGPIVLSSSAHISDIKPQKYFAEIDFKPALDYETLDARLLSDFSKNINKDFINSLGELLPQKAIEPMIEASGIDARKKVNNITKEERRALVNAIKHFSIPLSGFRPIDEAIITKGGVCLKEINPKTMESKLVTGLYFAGEILDLDAYTGGFNLQIAFSTAVMAGEAQGY